MNLRGITISLTGTMQCNCDLDNWEPEPTTGHSCVCRIHKAAIQQRRDWLRDQIWHGPITDPKEPS